MISSRLLTCGIKHKADKSMVSCEWQKYPINKNNVLKIIDDTLAVKEVHCCSQPVPVQTLCETQPTRTTGDIGDCNDLLEGDDLYSSHNGDNVEMSHEHGPKESSYHDKRPYRSRDEGLLLLFVIRHGFLLLLIRKINQQDYSAVFGCSQTSNVISVPSLGFAGEPGSDPPSLMSEKLLRRAPSILVL